jgi:hypothetical protein
MWAGGSPVTVVATQGERGSGTLMGLTILAAIALAGSSAIAVMVGLNEARHVQAVANQGALAASDVSRGVVSGHPCRVVSSLVSGAGFRLMGCEVNQGKAWIVVGGQWWGIDIEKRAHAGPPNHPVFRESE